MKRTISHIFVLLVISVIILSGCNDLDLALEPTRATIGDTSPMHENLVSLPDPREKVVIAIYKFRDQTGQYKTSETSTTFSTAVTQGATSMLIKALEDSGWFIPIERESLPNLLNERKIIRSSRMQYQAEGGEAMPALPPMLYAGVLLEGGIISYDTNYITGGMGVRYFGVGGSGRIRKDRVTIYLRLVSVKNGQVLKSVSTSKSVLSTEVDVGVYRYVSVQKILEAEAGLSTNEPTSICVLEAIEKAVCDLIIEGIHDGIWNLKNPQQINSPVIQSYFEEKGQSEKMVSFNKNGDLIKVTDIKQSKPVSSYLKDIIGKNNSENLERTGQGNIKNSQTNNFESAIPNG